MPDEFLPPVVTKLQGDIGDLITKLAEAKAALETFNKKVEEDAKAAGKGAGDGMGEEFKKAATVKGGQSAEELLKVFKATTSRGRFNEADMQVFAEDISNAFKKAGEKGALGLFQKFTDALHGGIGMDSTAGRAVVSSFEEFGTKGGLQAGGAFSGGFLSSVGTLAGAAAPVLIPLGAVLAAELVADIGAGMLAGAGGGAIALGIKTQLQDPEVKAAATGFGDFLKAEWKDATSPLSGYLISGFGGLKTDLMPVLTDMKVGFSALAPDVKLFAEMLGKAAVDFAPGFTRAMEQAKPVLAVIADELPTLFNAFNIFWDEVSKGAKGGAEGLDTFVKAMSTAVVALGFVIRAGADMFDAFIQGADKFWAILDKGAHALAPFSAAAAAVAGPLDDVHKYVDGIATSWDKAKAALDKLNPPMHKLTTEADLQRAAIDKLKTSYDTWFGASMTTDQAAITLAANQQALTDTLSKNKGQWDLNTQAGRDNHSALLNAIQSAKDYYDAEVRQYGDNPKFLKEYQNTIDKLLGQAKSAGDDAQSVQNLTNQFGGLEQSIQSIQPDVYITTHFMTEGTPPSQYYHGLAAGGFVPPVRAAQGLLPPRSPGTLVLAGEPETGGEVMIPQRGITTARAAALGRVAMAPYGMTVGTPVAAAPTSSGGGGGDLPPIVVQFVVDGRVFHSEVVMPAAQQHKKMYGSTGLT